MESVDQAPLAVSLLAALLLVVVHVTTPSLRFLDGVPRNLWLSLAGGVSVAYVFLHLLPELGRGQEALSRAGGGEGVFGGRLVYLVALVGLATFYGLERLGKTSRWSRRHAAEDDVTSPGVFWVHMATFAVYNAIVGYLLLHLEERTLSRLLLFATAMALHFLVTDFGLHEDHRTRYRRHGRWVLAAAVAAGVALGVAAELPEAVVASAVAFLGGGIVLNAVKEELPQERESRFGAFVAGAAAYAALLLVL